MSRLDRAALGALLAALLSGCTGDMYDQARLKPLRASEHWDDGRSSRDPVPGTVARGDARLDHHLHTGMVDGKPAVTMPFPIDAARMARGAERFRIYCAPCHGLDGEGRGVVVRRGMRQPPSYHIERLRQAPVGHFFDVMTRGYGVMYDFAYQLTPEDRWSIVAYIRALQLSAGGRLEDLAIEDRRKLEGAP